MTRKTLNLTDNLYEYLLSVSLHESGILRELRALTADMHDASLQISPEQGQFMALVMAQAMPEDGEIITCDINETTSAIAKSFWQKAGMEEKIRLVLAPAEETLSRFINENQTETFDFVFIDAEKTKNIIYYNLALELIRSGGLITVDNVLWSGKPADNRYNDEDTVATREFNEYIWNDVRVNSCIIPIADGLTLAVKN